jgi:hypothetical protein
MTLACRETNPTILKGSGIGPRGADALKGPYSAPCLKSVKRHLKDYGHRLIFTEGGLKISSMYFLQVRWNVSLLSSIYS